MRLIAWFLSLFRRRSKQLLPVMDKLDDLDARVLRSIDEHEQEKRTKEEARCKKKEQILKGEYILRTLDHLVRQMDHSHEMIEFRETDIFLYQERAHLAYDHSEFPIFMDVFGEFCKAKGIKHHQMASSFCVFTSSFREYIKRCKEVAENSKSITITESAYR
jgi:hypothetical protein